MADQSEPICIRHAPLVSFLRSIPVSDTDPRPKFEFLGAAIVDRREVGYFARDPRIWHYVDASQFYLDNLKHYYRTGDSSKLFLLAPLSA